MKHSKCSCAIHQNTRQLEWLEPEFDDFGGVHGGMEYEYHLSEAEEIELAAELLSVSSEEELDEFLGKLFKRIGRGLKKFGRFVGKKVLPTLGKGLKAIAKVALPVAGKVLGSFIPIPGVGTAVGGALGQAVSNALELEFGDMSLEDREFEIARRFVRIAATAAHRAALASPDRDYKSAVDEALEVAARTHLPYINADENAFLRMQNVIHHGRWLRRGGRIIVSGV
ncbi:MAG: hypothetical protein ACU843_13820 [Gammaproteobacteria bacterium]